MDKLPNILIILLIPIIVFLAILFQKQEKKDIDKPSGELIIYVVNDEDNVRVRAVIVSTNWTVFPLK
jgi:hypothetical protein